MIESRVIVPLNGDEESCSIEITGLNVNGCDCCGNEMYFGFNKVNAEKVKVIIDEINKANKVIEDDQKKLEENYIIAIKHILKQDSNRDAFAKPEYLKKLKEDLKNLT